MQLKDLVVEANELKEASGKSKEERMMRLLENLHLYIDAFGLDKVEQVLTGGRGNDCKATAKKGELK